MSDELVSSKNILNLKEKVTVLSRPLKTLDISYFSFSSINIYQSSYYSLSTSYTHFLDKMIANQSSNKILNYLFPTNIVNWAELISKSDLDNLQLNNIKS